MAEQKLRIAVMLETVQFSNIVGMDMLGNISKAYVQATAGLGLGDFTNVAPEIDFFYPTTSLETTYMTPGIIVKPTHTYDDTPRDLDILLMGGPLPTHRPKEADKFMKEAFPRTKAVMTTCIGSMWLASSGVMNGMKATTNRESLPIVKQLYPDIEWLDQRWVVDSKLWTSGGAGAGIDMIATYMLQNFDRELVEALGLRLLDFDPEAGDQFYKEPPNSPKKLLETDWVAVFSGGALWWKHLVDADRSRF